MPEPLVIAVVGHTNAGKTSLLRTLTRLFGEHAGTTPLAYLRGIRLALARTACCLRPSA